MMPRRVSEIAGGIGLAVLLSAVSARPGRPDAGAGFSGHPDR